MADTSPAAFPNADQDTSDVVWIDLTDSAPAVANGEYSIGELATAFGLTHRALRFYESRGMVTPRRVGRSRIYGQAEYDRLALIVKGKKLGFTLAEIAQMIDIQEGRASALTLRLTNEACAAQIAFFEQQMTFISEALGELRRIQDSLGAGSEPGGVPRRPQPF
jgi:DNA-binding transcriptional MerR regulator